MTEPAWSPPALPDDVRSTYSSAAVVAQRISWSPSGWADVFNSHPDLFSTLAVHAQETQGISRAFVHGLAAGDAVKLFLATMAWGYGNSNLGPGRVARILAQPEAEEKLAKIVETVQSKSAGLGWRALLLDYKISGLGMAFETKLLYFAGYYVCDRPRPLILDARVRKSLQQFTPPVVPQAGKTVWRTDYLQYLELAEVWAADPGWEQEPDVVELALFKGTRQDPNADGIDKYASPDTE